MPKRQKQRSQTKRQQPRNEAEMITWALVREYGVRAAVVSAVKTPAFIHYQLKVGNGERIDSVAKALPDVERRIYEYRQRRGQIERNEHGMPIAPLVRLDAMRSALEVSRHDPRPLSWSSRQWSVRPFSTLAGRAFDASGGYPVAVDLSDPNQSHVLVAGATGSGKSVLVNGLIAGLAESTPPSDLRMLLVDLDSEDFAPFVGLPHVDGLADDLLSAVDAIRYAASAMDNPQSHRIVLVIDELSLLITTDKSETSEVFDVLTDIAQRGRKHGVHLIAATQKPLSAQIGPLVKGNMKVRLCGSVASARDSNTVLDIPGAGAEKLPGRGAFVYRCGRDVYRMQAYNMADPAGVVAEIAASYQAYIAPDMGVYDSQPSPAIASYSQLPVEETADMAIKKAMHPVASYDIRFPIGEGRPLTDDEADAVRELVANGEFDYRNKLSMNRAMEHVFGSRSPDRAQWIREALNADEKILKLGRRA